MATKITKELRREVDVEGETYTVTLSPKGVRVTRKRFRSGVVIGWKDLFARRAPELEA